LGGRVEQIKEFILGQVENERKHTVLKIVATDFEGSLLIVHTFESTTHLGWLIVQ